jgi:hypothetical protein
VRIRKLETQLDIQKIKLEQADARLAAKRMEADEFRERMMAKDFAQVTEMRRLRQELQGGREALADGQALIKHKVWGRVCQGMGAQMQIITPSHAL